MSRRVCCFCDKVIRLWSQMEWAAVQILDVVANIQVEILKTEVEKGSKWTVFELGLVVSKSVAQLQSGNDLFFKKK